ncbi:MAG: tRNA preQ1(34) S-adenosylmethionine ribosyltransferase-isomerase QueA [Myxococcales bacterium]|nr:tRNA preQ1(34) S-adenosylmethionine ribosyltransferase-isomerase QueA [Myxococcales bacterium]
MSEGTPDGRSYQLSDYDFHLPDAQIAQHPAEPRDSARLLGIDRGTKRHSHHTIMDLPQLLPEGALLVVNDTQVVPARLRARKASGGRVELLLSSPLGGTHDRMDNHHALARSNKPLRVGHVLDIEGGGQAEVREVLGGGAVTVDLSGASSLAALLEQSGHVPLPPYIRGGRDDTDDKLQYQCTYATHPGAVAAPTAGLHLSERVLAALKDRGIERAAVTLHVGPGTFLPVRTENLRSHQVQAERFAIDERTARTLQMAKDTGRPIIAVGTTTTRVLETLGRDGIVAGTGWTDLTILPGHEFQLVSGLMSNFHLPRSSLLVLVSAFLGREPALAAYRVAVAAGYRFYSYGDATLML